MYVIPAIDVLEGKVVRLRKGRREEVTVYGDVEETIKRYQDEGIRRLHIVDLSAAFGETTNLLSRLEKFSDIEFQIGGGLRSVEKINQVLSSTNFDVIVGSILTTGEDPLQDRLFGLQTSRMIAALDVELTGSIFSIKDNGWLRDTKKNLIDVILDCRDIGFKSFLVTDISRDGDFTGPNLDLYKLLIKKFSSISLIASGGVRSGEDFETLASTGVQSVVVGKAIYENKISLSEVMSWQP